MQLREGGAMRKVDEILAVTMGPGVGHARAA